MPLVFISTVLYLKIETYRNLSSEFPTEKSQSPLPHLRQDTLPLLNYPNDDCSTSCKSHIVRSYQKTFETNHINNHLPHLNLSYMGWYGRRNGFAPSSTRYINSLKNPMNFGFNLFLVTARMLTPSYTSLGLYSPIFVGNEPRLYYPSWLTELNLYQRRQNSDFHPGALIREVPCQWYETKPFKGKK